MIHYVDNLNTKAIEVYGIQTATFTEKQIALCGLELKVKSRKEFATSNNGIGVVDCPDCLAKFKERINRPFDCESCRKKLDSIDLTTLTPYDLQRLCVKCNEKLKINTMKPNEFTYTTGQTVQEIFSIIPDCSVTVRCQSGKITYSVFFDNPLSETQLKQLNILYKNDGLGIENQNKTFYFRNSFGSLICGICKKSN